MVNNGILINKIVFCIVLVLIFVLSYDIPYFKFDMIPFVAITLIEVIIFSSIATIIHGYRNFRTYHYILIFIFVLLSGQCIKAGNAKTFAFLDKESIDFIANFGDYAKVKKTLAYLKTAPNRFKIEGYILFAFSAYMHIQMLFVVKLFPVKEKKLVQEV